MKRHLFILALLLLASPLSQADVSKKTSPPAVSAAEVQDFIAAHNKSTAPQSELIVPGIDDSQSKETFEEVLGTSKHTTLSFDQSSRDETPTTNQIVRPNFENADLSNFISHVAKITNINVIPSKDTQGAKVSLNMRQDLSKDEVWEVFLTVLETAGFTINKSGHIYKVIRSESKRSEPLPAYINVAARDLPDSERSIRFVTFLSNIQAAEVEPLLKGMLGPGGDIIRQDNVNGFIITDRCYNIKSAMKVINELDNSGLQEMVSVLPLKKTPAQDAKKLLDELTKSSADKGNPLARALGLQRQEGSEYFSVATKVIVEERSNSLILLGNKRSIKKIENFVAKYIEHENKNVESPIHRYQLEYADATQVKQILEEVVNSPTDSGVEKHGGVRYGAKYFKKMRFEVDKETNSIFVSAPDKQDWKLLKQTISDIDKPQPQVAIEVLLVDVDLRDSKEFGSQLRSPRADQPFTNLKWQSAQLGSVVSGDNNLLGNLGSILTSAAQGSTVLSLSRGAGDIWAVFKALHTQFNTSLVDNNFLTISNRVKGHMKVGEKRQVKKEDYNGFSGSGEGYQQKEAGTSLDFTPQINMDGLINLDVNVSIEDFKANGEDTTNKMLKTNLSVANGQVIVLGGFVKTKADQGLSEAPFLSRIPVLGWLFKSKNRTVSKVYTFIFICPTIIKPRTAPGVNLYTRMKLNRAKAAVRDAIDTETSKDPIHNWLFNPDGETYHHKVPDFASARYQPTTVDPQRDPYYLADPLMVKQGDTLNTGKPETDPDAEEEDDVLFEVTPQKRHEIRSQKLQHVLAQSGEVVSTKEEPEQKKISGKDAFKQAAQDHLKAARNITFDHSNRNKFKSLLEQKPAIGSGEKPIDPNRSRAAQAFKALAKDESKLSSKQPKDSVDPYTSKVLAQHAGKRTQFKNLLSPESTAHTSNNENHGRKSLKRFLSQTDAPIQKGHVASLGKNGV